MRASFLISLLAGVTFCTAASAYSWHRPNVYEETNSEYTNYNYDDGMCQYHYSYNNYDKHAQINRYGDCDHLLIGPDGHVMQSDMDQE
jgi:hypothetical protein